MQKNYFFASMGALLCSLMLTACADYSFHINERTVYTPPPLFKDYKLADRALHRCVEQTIKDNSITAAEQLNRLNCSSAGIESLEGLERFRHISELNLANNQLTDVEQLRRLSRLEVLILRENQLQSAAPLLSLVHLARADLSDNPDLPCGDARQLANQAEGTVVLPEQCR
ncbi:leucine-rich repeat domain-containing protein [Marinimicrobium sp. ABcell2]|uniref:leucine-rich repeat domain-containing protein n=1 Tax=Marinimicrobium sp. ABcell2 TaxID=3069751 RepID=UPI0027B1553C|nr:leucine-rich repeat domain-containing protein [Marinimicrobium sp. ABcell2]MDQ2078305.1 leucine-rich repeat domain-containing protein [Marinimicrobium sp. ABcell2]